MISNSHNSVAHSLRIRQNDVVENCIYCRCKSDVCAFECAMRNGVAQCNEQQIEMFDKSDNAHSQPSIEGALSSALTSLGHARKWQEDLLKIGDTTSEETFAECFP